ncbi:MAG: histidinol-phosphate transaminase, partial [Clostridiales bacterium]|nr:histidinol-phosphate transaminase [Clostridiales bacterium]
YKPNNPGNKIKLDANESIYKMPEAVKRDIISWLENEENLHIYPDTDSTILREALADFWNNGGLPLAPENIICGVGSDQIIDYITKALLDCGDRILTIEPTFSMYSLAAALNHGQIARLETPASSGFYCEPDVIIEAAHANRAKILFICTPNNPTGHDVKPEDIIKITGSVDAMVVVDEAYAEFSGATMLGAFDRFDNLIIMRTFSKAWGLAGLRVGYAVARPEIIRALEIVKAPFNLSTFTQLAAVSALRHADIYKDRVRELKQLREQLLNGLSSAAGITVYNSTANFVFAESHRDLAAELARHGILVRGFGSRKTEASGGEIFSVRISVGTKEQNEEIIRILKETGGL